MIAVSGGLSTWLRVSENSTVDSVKAQLTLLLPGEPKATKQILFFRNAILKGQDTMRSLGIGPRATVLLIAKATPKKTETFSLRWNTSYARGEVRFGKENRCVTKMSSAPDVTVVFGDRTFSRGCIRFDVLIHAKGDEMWVGVTDKPSVLRTVTGGAIRRHPRIWGYCDGSRGNNFVCGGKILPDCSSSHDCLQR